MNHLSFLFFLFSLFAGLAAIFTIIFLYFKYHKLLLLYYALWLLSLFIILLSEAFELYLKNTGLFTESTLFYILKSIRGTGILALIITLPLFIHRLLERPMTKIIKGIYFMYMGLSTIIIFIYIFYPDMFTINYRIINSTLIVFVYLYSIVLCFLYIKRIKDPLFRKPITAFFIISLLFFPMTIPLPSLNMFILAIYFLVLSLGSIILGFIYYSHLPYYKYNQITNSFKRFYNLTDREIEIIEYMLKGFSNRKIANTLYISQKTVHNHTTSIYQKTAAQNRIQLFNFIMSHKI